MEARPRYSKYCQIPLSTSYVTELGVGDTGNQKDIQWYETNWTELLFLKY